MPSFHLSRRQVRVVLFVLFALAGTRARPAAAAGMRLIDFGQLGYQSQITPNGASDVATELVEDPRGKALEIRCTAGANANPGIVVRPGAGLKWNLAAYGEVEADVVNLSDVPLVINLRVDNPGGADSRETRGNSDRLTLPVGKSGTVRVYFGYSLGKKASYALEPAKINQLVLFTAKPAKGEATFRVTAIRANGKPGDKPAGTSDEAAPPTMTPTPAAIPAATPAASAGPGETPNAAPAASPSVSPGATPAATPGVSPTPAAGKRAATLPAPPTSSRAAPAAVKRSADKAPPPSPSVTPEKSASPSPVPSATPEASATATATVSPAASATPPVKKEAVSPSPSPSPSATPKKG